METVCFFKGFQDMREKVGQEVKERTGREPEGDPPTEFNLSKWHDHTWTLVTSSWKDGIGGETGGKGTNRNISAVMRQQWKCQKKKKHFSY